MAKRVCMVSLRHPTLDARIYYKQARTLRDAGYDVHLICELRNNAFTNMAFEPVGYPDSTGVWRYDGMTFYGIPRRKGFLGKLKGYQQLVKLGTEIRADVYHCHESDFALAASIKIKRILGGSTKLVYDSHELWSACWAETIAGRHYSLAMPVLRQIEKRLLRYADKIIAADVPTAGILQEYDLRKKVEVIYNSPVINSLRSPEVAIPQFSPGKVVLCHEGALDQTRKVEVAVELIERLKDRCVLYVIGCLEPADDVTAQKVKKLEAAGVIVNPGWVPYECLNKALEPAHIGLILLKNHPNYLTAAPNKLFNYMASAMPIVADDYPGLRDVIQRCRCGIMVKAGELENYVQAIEFLINNLEEAREMGLRGKNAIHNELSWAKQAEKLLQLYSELLEPRPFVNFLHNHNQLYSGNGCATVSQNTVTAASKEFVSF